MCLKQLPISMLVVWLLFTAFVRAQDNPLDDPDLQQLLKQAQEMQRNARELQKNPGSVASSSTSCLGSVRVLRNRILVTLPLTLSFNA
jgi:hypothetical protein